jgi:charged multivesicular body protein 7
MQTAVLLLLALPALAFAAQTFDGLRVTWDLNPLDTWAFDVMPRDINNDYKHGFTSKDDLCNGGTFRGKRWWYKDDPATMLLFDVNGYIAGIQTGVPKSTYTPPSQVMNHPFIDDGPNWTLTIYFVDPSIICTTGRTAAEYASEGTGRGWWIQNGTNPELNSIHVPETESAMAGTKWTKGKCFYTMGLHYWYDVTVSMDCNGFFPFFVMYNKGVMNSGGFAINTHLTSKRYEHPPTFVIGGFMNPVPDCFHNDPNFAKLSTQHIYMHNNPRTTSNC